MCFRRSALLLFAIPFVWSCGDLEEDGSINVDLVPANVQDIFDSRCATAGCHVAGHSKGLDLRESMAYGKVVNEPSFDKPAVDRVEPGSASNSYLYQKITGAPGIVGDPMPLSGGALSQNQTDLIAAWIDQGAQTREQQPNVVFDLSFVSHIAPIFMSNCGGCHDGSGGSLPASMNLLGDTYNAIVGTSSVQAPGYKRVRASMPDSSYLYHKIIPTSAVRINERMPAGGPYLSDATIDSIRVWIFEGAQNN